MTLDQYEAYKSDTPKAAREIGQRVERLRTDMKSVFGKQKLNRRDAPNVSGRKSSDQRSPGLRASGIGVRDPRARFRPRGRLMLNVSSVYNRYSFLWFIEYPFALQHHADPPIAKPAALGRDGLHLLAYLRVVRRAFAPDRFWVDTDKSTGPTLRDTVIPHRPERGLSPLIRRRQLFPSKSFRTTLSSIVSASRRLSLAFSSSNDLSFATSDTSMPPYFDLYL